MSYKGYMSYNGCESCKGYMGYKSYMGCIALVPPSAFGFVSDFGFRISDF